MKLLLTLFVAANAALVGWAIGAEEWSAAVAPGIVGAAAMIAFAVDNEDET